MNILASVSGGRTSAYMAMHLQEWYPGANIVYMFANTGLEHPGTIDFIRRLPLPIVCIEAVISPIKGVGVSYRVVPVSELSTNGSPFLAAIQKFDTPNVQRAYCTRELKSRPLYLAGKEYFGGEKYYTAIGIRCDEFDRMAAPNEVKKRRLIYPLIEKNIYKSDVLDFFSKRPDIDLKIPRHLGNCVSCFKKSMRQLSKAKRHAPEYFDFWENLEQAGYAPPFRNRVSVSDIDSAAFQLSMFDDPEMYSCDAFTNCG